MQIQLEKTVKCQIHFFSSYTQGAGDAGPRITRTFLTAKISKFQEATRIPPYTVRIPSVYHARIPAVYHRIPSVYQPYTIRIPCQDPTRIPPYTVRIPAVYHPYTMPGSQPYTPVYRPYTSRIPSVYHHGPRLHYRPYTTRIPHRPHPPSPCFQVLFFSFPLSSFQGLKQGLTNKRRRKFCGAMGNVQS